MKAQIDENGVLCLGIETGAENEALQKYIKDNEGMVIIDSDVLKPMYVKIKGLKILVFNACLNNHI